MVPEEMKKKEVSYPWNLASRQPEKVTPVQTFTHYLKAYIRKRKRMRRTRTKIITKLRNF